MTSTRQAAPPMNPAKTTYAPADTPTAMSRDGRSWTQKPTSAARTAALPRLAASGTRTAGRTSTGATRPTPSGVYDTAAPARLTAADANATGPNHGTDTSV